MPHSGLIAAIRREGRRNLESLRRIQDATTTDDLRLSLVRVFDIALWFAGFSGMRSRSGAASHPPKRPDSQG